jgi:hypothetical protein
LKWTSNTENLVEKATKRFWILRRLKNLGACETDLLDVFIKQIQSVLELAVPVWNGSITLAEQIDLDRIQNCAAHIILVDSNTSYKDALKSFELKSLKSRRDNLCMKFAKKAEKDEKFKAWFKTSNYKKNTRQSKNKYCEVLSKHSRFKKSPLSVLKRILNGYHKNK